MNSRFRLLFWLVLLAVVAVVLFFVFRRDTQAAYGPQVALCPGPDFYGYTCEPGGNYAYIDATEDTGLYEDDGVTAVSLPFPFTFYGTTYTSLTLGSNGTLQLGDGGAAEFLNRCLDGGPAPAMGDLIAPYWDDLDLTFVGFLETAVIGEAPNRIFVAEWDGVPRFDGDFEDTLTFEVQLFEGSSEIVFLYQDVTVLDESRGDSATVGLQSAAQGLALQYSCNQPVLADALGIAFTHPEVANGDVGLETAVQILAPSAPAAKGPAQELLSRLAQREPGALTSLQQEWLAQNPPRRMVWHELDLTGNGRNELVVLWHGPAGYPYLSQLAVIGVSENGYTPLLNQLLSSRNAPVSRMFLVATADLTGDGLIDALLWDEASSQTAVITQEPGTLSLLPLPGSCQDEPVLRAGQILCRGSASDTLMMAAWNGREFSLISKP